MCVTTNNKSRIFVYSFFSNTVCFPDNNLSCGWSTCFFCGKSKFCRIIYYSRYNTYCKLNNFEICNNINTHFLVFIKKTTDNLDIFCIIPIKFKIIWLFVSQNIFKKKRKIKSIAAIMPEQIRTCVIITVIIRSTHWSHCLFLLLFFVVRGRVVRRGTIVRIISRTVNNSDHRGKCFSIFFRPPSKAISCVNYKRMKS